MGTVLGMVVGFGWEALTFIFWLVLSVVVSILLVNHVKWFKDKLFIASSITGVIVIFLIGDYRAFLFWMIIFVLIIVVTAAPFVEVVTKRFSWMRSFTYYGICAFIVITVFMIMRAVMFQDVPDQMWYQ